MKDKPDDNELGFNNAQLQAYIVEFEQLCINIRFLHQSYWVGFSAYFAMNTLLGTAMHFSPSPVFGNFTGEVSGFFPASIALIGVFSCVAAIFTAWRIYGFIGASKTRGHFLDGKLKTNAFINYGTSLERRPWLTTIGATLFGLAWLFLLSFQLRLDGS